MYTLKKWLLVLCWMLGINSAAVMAETIKTLPTPQLLRQIEKDLQKTPFLNEEVQNFDDYQLTVKDSSAITEGLSKCLYPTSTSARLAGKLEVGFQLTDDTKVFTNSVRLLASENFEPSEEKAAYGLARRVILRCGAKGFPSIDVLNDETKQIRLVFEFPELDIAIISTEGVSPTFENPIRIAAPTFVVDKRTDLAVSEEITSLVSLDLQRSGVFKPIDERAHIGKVSSLNATIDYGEWTAINAQVLITGAIEIGAGDTLTVSFRVHDVFAGREYGKGLQFKGRISDWRRIAHKVADEVYSRITGESGYFDSRIVFVSENGSKKNRRKRIAIMEHDGAQLEYLTDGSSLVLSPQISPNGQSIVFISYESGSPKIYLMDLITSRIKLLQDTEGTSSYAPSFSPDGTQIVYAQEKGGNVDIFLMSLRSGTTRRLTSANSIDTAPSFSPDGSQIVFQSDRSGSPQLYKMNSYGGDIVRISFGDGAYMTPVWSPIGGDIAFVKQGRGRFHIGLMKDNGAEENIITASDLDESPSWSPNGQYIIFSRTYEEGEVPSIFQIGRNGYGLQRVITPEGGSFPSWSGSKR